MPTLCSETSIKNRAIAKPLKGFLGACSSSLLGYRILSWNGIKKIKKYSGYVIYIVHVELVVAKLLSKRKGSLVWFFFFQKALRFQNQLIFSGSSRSCQLHSNECALSSGLLWLLLGSVMCLGSDRNSLVGSLMKMQS